MPTATGTTLRNVQAWMGAALIAAAILLTTRESSFPGWWAVMPTLGTALIIAAGTQAWLNHFVLSNRVLVWFGLISFPLYLWHWPLLSFARIVEVETPTRNIRIAAVIVSIALAWLTYRLIETPIRFGRFKKIKTIFLILPMIIIGYVGYNTYSRDGLRFRAIEKSVQQYSNSITRSDRMACVDLPFAYKKDGDWFCTIGNSSETPAQVFVYGDSHAFSLLPALERLSIESNINILFASSSGCLPLLGVEVNRGADWLEKYNCPKLNDRIFEYVKKNGIKNVFLISYWTYYSKSNVGPSKDNIVQLNDLQLNEIEDANNIWQRGPWYDYGIENTINKYKEIGVNLFVFEDNPTQIYFPKDALRKARRPASDVSINKFSISKDAHKNRQSYIASAFRNIDSRFATVVNFDSLLCIGDICPLVVDGNFAYYDTHHLSTSGAMQIYPKIKSLPLIKK